jgi:hypothetical protein
MTITEGLREVVNPGGSRRQAVLVTAEAFRKFRRELFMPIATIVSN